MRKTKDEAEARRLVTEAAKKKNTARIMGQARGVAMSNPYGGAAMGLAGDTRKAFALNTIGTGVNLMQQQGAFRGLDESQVGIGVGAYARQGADNNRAFNEHYGADGYLMRASLTGGNFDTSLLAGPLRKKAMQERQKGQIDKGLKFSRDMASKNFKQGNPEQSPTFKMWEGRNEFWRKKQDGLGFASGGFVPGFSQGDVVPAYLSAG